MLKFINLYDHAEARKIDYTSLFESIKIRMHGDDDMDLSVIIPAYGREGFLEPLIDSFRKALPHSPVKVGFTVVEHSEIPLHLGTASRIGINHIWIPKKEDEYFNKCLAMNVGAAKVPAREYIFHDLDCIVQSGFFRDIYLNIESKESNALQTFSDRRVLYLNPELTLSALLLELDIDSLVEGSRDPKDPEYNGVTPPGLVGAPGGSIWIRKDTFIQVGGYDPNVFFGYSPEDIFFWDKVSTVADMDTCTEPRVEIFHMHHPPTHASNPHIRHLIDLHQAYKGCTEEEKGKFLKLQRDSLLEAYG